VDRFVGIRGLKKCDPAVSIMPTASTAEFASRDCFLKRYGSSSRDGADAARVETNFSRDEVCIICPVLDRRRSRSSPTTYSAAPFCGHCSKWSVLRKGAVRKRTQLKGKVMAKAAWTKRDKTPVNSWRLKKSAKNSKACGAKRLLKATVSGRGHPGPSLDHLRPRRATGSTD
jgi:hypothetical protein